MSTEEESNDDKKPNPEQYQTVQAPKRWPKYIRRVLKYTLLAILLAVSVLTAATWARSSKTADRVHGVFWRDQCFIIGSRTGSILLVQHQNHYVPGWRGWRIASDPIEDELSFPTGRISQFVNRLGFGTMKDPFYQPMRRVLEQPDGKKIRVSGAASAHYRGWGVIVPHWFVLLVTGSLLTLIVLGRRFTLRAFLIWVTIVCVILGIAMRSSADANIEKGEGVQHGE